LKTFKSMGHVAIGLEGAQRFVDMARDYSGCEVWQQDLLSLDLPGERFDGVFVPATVGGPDRGATYGFLAGLLFDLVLDSPFGLSALTYAAVGYAVGLASVVLFRPTGWWPLAVGAVAALVATVFYTGVGHLIGTPYPWGEVPAITVAVALWNVALVLPAMAVMRWVHGPSEPDRIEVLLR